MRAIRLLFGIWTLADIMALRKVTLLTGRSTQLFDELARFRGFEDFVKAKCAAGGFRLWRWQVAGAARMVAGDIHKRGQKVVVRQSAVLSKLKPAQIAKDYLVTHRFAWESTLSEDIIDQAWGELGDARKKWVHEDQRWSTARFGIGKDFEEHFLAGEAPFYVELESDIGDLKGKVYKRIRKDG